MKKTTVLLVFLFIFSFSLHAYEITPPAWIQGRWQMNEDAEKVFVFFKNDMYIVVSVRGYLQGEFIADFTQEITDTSYSIYFERNDGEWERMVFSLSATGENVLTLLYCASTAENGAEKFSFTRINDEPVVP